MKIHRMIILLALLWGPMAAAQTNLNVGVEYSSESIGIDILAYPELYAVPGYPVYYAPSLGTNYFFYDGMYWVYQNDYWYMGSWFDGPWLIVDPLDVPQFILRIPVHYYRQPPFYFSQWMPEAPPHWGEQWGADWEQQRRGWDSWNQFTVPPPAPLPNYQRQYSGARYPRFMAQQREIEMQHYRYRPREPEVWRNDRKHSGQRTPAQSDSRQQYRQRWPDDPASSRFESPPTGGESFLEPPDLSQPGGMNIQAPPGQSPGPAQRELWAPAATDQQNWHEIDILPKKQKK